MIAVLSICKSVCQYVIYSDEFAAVYVIIGIRPAFSVLPAEIIGNHNRRVSVYRLNLELGGFRR